jgi:uncharacterized membrane protein required for colicin V production
MNWIDIILFLVLAGGTTLGVFSGFIWQLARIISLIVAIYVTFLIQPFISSWLVGRMSNPFLANLICYIVIFAVIYLILFFIVYFIEKSISKAELTPLDRIFGAILGLLKISLICGTVLLGMVVHPGSGMNNSLKNSFFTPILLQYTKGVVFLMPRDYRGKVRYFIRQVQNEKAESAKPVKK